MATTKYLDYAGLEYIVGKLYARGFKGMGLSQEDFTTELKNKLNALVAASSPDDLADLFGRVQALEELIQADSDGAINKFNEIVTFLAGITDDKDLQGMLADIATQIAAAKKAGDDAQAALDAYKTENATALAGKVDVVTGKGLSTNDYTNTDKAAVATIADKLNASDIAAITEAEIDEVINPTTTTA